MAGILASRKMGKAFSSLPNSQKVCSSLMKFLSGLVWLGEGSKTHKRLKERFLIRWNRTKRANFRCNHLFQATYNRKELKFQLRCPWMSLLLLLCCPGLFLLLFSFFCLQHAELWYILEVRAYYFIINYYY